MSALPQDPSVPFISVVIPAHNAADHIEEALASVAAQEGGFALEVIVVDDGSTDATAACVRDFAAAVARSRPPREAALSVRLISQANAGPAAARNRGVRAAAGAWIAFLDADDRWPPERLRVQVPALLAHPQAGLVFGDCRHFDAGGAWAQTQFASEGLKAVFPQDPTLIEDPYPRLLAHNFIPTGSVLARRDCLLTAGLFDESLRLVEDLDLWLRMALHGPMVCTHAVCQLKRTHAGNLSADRDAMALAYIEVLRAQARTRAGALAWCGVRVGRLIAWEYCLLGHRCEGRGDRAGARRAYGAAWRSHPSLRPLWYWLRSWRRGPPARTGGAPP